VAAVPDSGSSIALFFLSLGALWVLSGFGHAAQKSLIDRIFIHLERLFSPSDERFQLFIRGICVHDKPQVQAFETHRHGRSPQPALGARSCANADSA
jgi:hypothetical protein